VSEQLIRIYGSYCCCCVVLLFERRLARYNEPWLPPPFRRNEVLIDLNDFRWT
jgi:hypothetical protein